MRSNTSPSKTGVFKLLAKNSVFYTFANSIEAAAPNLSVQDALRMHFYEMKTEERARFVWGSFCLSVVCLFVIVSILLSVYMLVFISC